MNLYSAHKALKARIVAFAILSACYVLAYGFAVFSDSRFHDLYYFWQKAEHPSSKIFILTHDGISEERFGAWPYGVEQLHALAAYLREASPLQVIVDGTVDPIAGALGNTSMPIYSATKFFGELRPDRDGLYRMFPLTVSSQGYRIPSVAVEAAQNISSEAGNALGTLARGNGMDGGEETIVRFSGFHVRYPTVQLYKLIEGDIDPLIFENATLIIDPFDGRHNIASPYWRKGTMTPRAQYLGEAIETLAAGKGYWKPPLALDLIIPWLFVFALFLFGTAMTYRKELLIYLGSAAVLVGAHCVLFNSFSMVGHISLPVFLLLLSAVVSLIFRMEGIDSSSAELESSVHYRTKDLIFLPQEEEVENPWTTLGYLGEIYLDADAQVFYQVNERTGEITVAHSLGRMIADRVFHYADGLEPPFQEAASRRSVLETALPGLVVEGEVFGSYLVPLKIGKRILGFWGIVIKEPARSVSEAGLKRIITNLADEITGKLARQLNISADAPGFYEANCTDAVIRRLEITENLVTLFRKNEKYVQDTFAHMPLGMVLLQLSGETVFYNEAASKRLGEFSVSPSEPDLLTAMQDLSGARPEIFQARLLDMLSRLTSMEFQAKSGRGNEFGFSINVVSDQVTGHPFALLLRIEDITEQARRESTHKGLVASFVAPMRTMADRVRESARELEERVGEVAENRELLFELRYGNERVLEMLRGLEEAVTGPKTHEMVRITPLELCRLVEKAVQSKSASRDLEGIDLRLDVPERELYVMGNWRTVYNTVSDILDLSLSHTPDGEQVWITVREEGDAVVLKVEDSGYGFPREYAVNLESGGELAMMRSRIENIGGQFVVDSNLGQEGTRFRITLPKVG